jgi:hypothetical protein
MMYGAQDQTVLQGRKTERGHIPDIEAQLDRRLPFRPAFTGRMQKDGLSAVCRAQSGDHITRLPYHAQPEKVGQNSVISEMRPLHGMFRPNVGCAGLFPLHRRRHRSD